MTTAKNSASNDIARYTYDADGHRTRRSILTGNNTWTETWQVYGVSGELVAEYAANTSASSPQKEYGYRGGEMLIVAESSDVKWTITDHLGSPRMVIGKTGALANTTRHDYLPFGEELIGIGLRSSTPGYTDEGLRQQFTGYERDDETGLDYAQARYYSNIAGRFTSPDPLLSSGAVEEPQSWNRYSYVGNRPLNVTDPSGLIWAYNSLTGDLLWFDGTREQFREVFGANSGWRIIDGQTFVVTRSGVTNDQSLSTGHRYYLDPSGRAIDLGQNYDPLHEFIHQMGRRATATEHLIGVAAIPQLLTVGVIAGGELAAVAMYGSEMTTLGLEGASFFDAVIANGTRAQLNGLISQVQRNLLKQLLDNGNRASEILKKLLETKKIPEDLTKQTLEVYREIARRVVVEGRGGAEAVANQVMRLKVIEEAIKILDKKK
jgi:RHS repeat-associated protein